MGLWATIAADAAAESPLWREALRDEREEEPVFSTLADARYALGLETIYEGYLVHYGRPRLFAPNDDDSAHLRAEGEPGDGEAWAETARRLEGDGDDAARKLALAAHARRVG